MIDFHSHILPGIDDGAKTVEDSLFLIDTMHSLGAAHIVLTPHFYPSQKSITSFVESRNAACKLLAEELQKKQIDVPKLHLGCEVYLEPIIFNYDDLTPLTIDLGGKFILTELLYDEELTNSTMSMLNKLVYSHNLIPILAHIDRYPFLMKEKTLVSLLDMGCIAQINVSALTKFFTRKKLIKYLEKGYIGVIGSDIHNKSYIPDIKSGLSYMNNDDLEYVTEISKGILKTVKKDSDSVTKDIIVD